MNQSFCPFQYAVGFFSFLLLLICNKGTASFRAGLVPVHAAFGILTFVLGVTACLTGLTEKAIFGIGYVFDSLYVKFFTIRVVITKLVKTTLLTAKNTLVGI